MLAKRTHFLQKLVDQLKTELKEVKAQAAQATSSSSSKTSIQTSKQGKNHNVAALKRTCNDLQTAQARLLMQVDETATYTWKCLQYARTEIKNQGLDNDVFENIPSLSLAEPLGKCTLGEQERILTLLFEHLNSVDAGSGSSMAYATNASRSRLRGANSLELPTIAGRRRSRSVGSVGSSSRSGRVMVGSRRY